MIISLCMAIILALVLPKSYLSSTLILVEPQQVPTEYVRATVSGSVEDRLSTIRQQILSRSLLQRIIDEFHLYQDQIGRTPTETIIESMRQKITIETVKGKNVDAFTISYIGNDPATTMKVTNALASLFIEENLKIREKRVKGTTTFLGDELQQLKVKLERHEREIGTFKQRHMGALPGQMEANLHTLDRLQLQLQTISTALREAENRRLMIGQMAQDQSKAAVPPGGMVIDSRLTQLQMLQNRLITLRAEYTENYPDIAATKQEIEQLESRLQGEVSQANGSAAGKPSSLRPPSLDQEVARLQAEQQSLLDQIKLYQERVEETPKREQELAGLMRDYENTKRNYDSLLSKESDAKISENLEKRQKGEQFRVIDPAYFPEKPSSLSLRILLALGVILGVGIGGGLTVIIEYLDTSIKRAEELEAQFGLPVLGVIPKADALRTGVRLNGSTVSKARVTSQGGERLS